MTNDTREWVMVRREPTPEMMERGLEQWSNLRDMWEAMVNASPAAPPTEADMRAFGASEEACIRYPGEDQQPLRQAFMLGAAAAAPPAHEVVAWRPIDTAPRGRKVIVSVPNGKNHKPITMMGRYWPHGTLEVADGYEGEDWAVEVDGVFYMLEGWYEECEGEDAPAHNISPAHWMPLPAAPGAHPLPSPSIAEGDGGEAAWRRQSGPWAHLTKEQTDEIIQAHVVSAVMEEREACAADAELWCREALRKGHDAAGIPSGLANRLRSRPAPASTGEDRG